MTTMKLNLALAGCLGGLLLCVPSNPAWAGTVTWDGSGDTTWSQPDSTSWSGGTYNSGDDVVFGDTGVGAVTLSGTLTPGHLAFQHSSGTYTFGYTSPNQINATGNLTLSGGGTAQFGNLGNTPSALSSLLAWSGTTTISGGSTLAVTRPGTLGGAGSTVTLDGGSLRLGADNSSAYTLGNPFSIGDAGGTLGAQFTGNQTRFTLNGNFTGGSSAILRLQTVGTASNFRNAGWILGGSDNSGFAGAVVVESLTTPFAGVTLLGSSASRFSGASSVTVRNGGILAVSFAAANSDFANMVAGTRGGVGAIGANGSLSALTDVSAYLGEGGYLLLDNSDAINNNRVSDTTTLALKSGNLYLTGRAANTQTVTEDSGPITYAGGCSLTFRRDNNTANYVTWQADSLTRASGTRGTFTIGLVGTGTALGSTASLLLDANLALDNGMATPAIVNAGTHDWVTTSGSGPYSVATFSGYTTYADQTSVTLGGSSEVSKLTFSTASTGNALLQNSTTVYALNIANSATAAARGLDLNGNTLTIGSGGVILARLSSQNAQIIGTGALAFGGNEALIYTAGSGTTISAPITGSGGLTKFGSGTLTLGSTANNFSGGIVVNEGFLDASGSTDAGGELITCKNPLTVAAPATVTIRNATYGGVSGRGTVTAQAGNAGTLILETAAATTHTFNGALQNNGTRVLTLKKTGEGTQVFGGDSIGTFTGTTTVSNGTLLVNGNFAAVTNTITVFANATLGGAGVLGGAVTVNLGGTLSPGASPGTLTVSNTVTLAGTTVMELQRASSPNADKLVASAITAGGALVVTNLGGALQDNDTFDLFDGPISGTFASVTLPDLSGGLGWNTDNLYVNGTIQVVGLFNNPPVAANHTLGTIMNQPVTIPLARLLRGCTDADNDPLTVSAVSATSTNGGAVTLASTNVIYTPVANYVGADAFTYTVSDGRGGTADGTVFVTVSDGRSFNIVGYAYDAGTGTMTITFAGIPGYTYRVQYTESLTPPITWTDLGTNTAPPHGVFQFVDTVGTSTNRFYRTAHP